MSTKTENKWRDSSLRPFLDELPECAYFIKEAKSVRGLPDLVGVFAGVPFYLEIKKNKQELSCPRTKLQEYMLSRFENAGAFTSFIYPENAREVLLTLLERVFDSSMTSMSFDDYKSIKEVILASF